MPRVYLDYNATAPLRPEARDAMLRALDAVGNASSVHGEGRAARARVEAARADVARLVGGDPKLVTFTSGGTEANDTVLTPRWTAARQAASRGRAACRRRPSILRCLPAAASRRIAVSTIPVDGDGVIDLDSLQAHAWTLAGEEVRALVSVMLANNETGAIQPVAEVAGSPTRPAPSSTPTRSRPRGASRSTSPRSASMC